MKRYIPLLLIMCMLLCACAQEAPGQTTGAPVNTTTAPSAADQTTAPEESQPTEETTVPPETTEQVVEVLRFRNPLTGRPMAEELTARPFAVTINNIQYAMPMCSLNNADMVIEILAEGGITRCLAVYSDISGLEHIGSIRSTRPYLVDIAESFDAIYVHHGGSNDGYDEIYGLGTDNLDALTNAVDAYYRDQNRLDNGYALEHTSFADGDDLIKAAQDRGYETTRDAAIDYGLQFADKGSTDDGQDAKDMTVVFGGFGKTTKLTYDETAGMYTSAQYGKDIVDGNTGADVTFRNVIFITAETYSYVDVNNVQRLDITLTGEGDGYFACDGKVVPIHWSRASKYDPFVYTLTDGTPITLGVGNTYLAVAPLSGELNCE